jgi:MFS family permease
MGFYNASFHLGLSAGPFAGILLHRHFKNPDAPIFYYIAASFSAALLIWLLSENPVRFKHQKTKKADIASVKQIINSKRIRIILAGIVLYGAGYGYFVTLIPAYLISSKNFSAMEIGMYFTLFYIAISLVQLAAGPFSDRWERAGFMIEIFSCARIAFSIFGNPGYCAC